MRLSRGLLLTGKLGLLTFVAAAVLSPVPAAAGMTHRYVFDGPTVTDSVGQAHGTSICASVQGGVLSLDGDRSYVQLTGKIVPSSGSFTVMLFSRETLPVAGFIELISQGDGSRPGFFIRHSPSYGIQVSDSWGNTGIPFPSDGQWHHYAVSSDVVSNATVLYVDGARRTDLSRALTVTAGGADTRLGGLFFGGSFFRGLIADVQVWNEALSPIAISVAAAARPSQPGSGVSGRWTSSGPCSISGRVQAVAVDPANADHWLLGAAAGGVWETRDAGTSWSPRTDDQASLAMGQIAFAPSDPRVVYAGTGELCATFQNSCSTYPVDSA